MLWAVALQAVLCSAVRYEAESAFLAGRPFATPRAFATLDTPAKMLHFSVPADQTKQTAIELRYAASNDFNFEVAVNGLDQKIFPVRSSSSSSYSSSSSSSSSS